MGQRRGFSRYDIKMANAMYDCPGKQLLHLVAAVVGGWVLVRVKQWGVLSGGMGCLYVYYVVKVLDVWGCVLRCKE